MTAVLVIEDDDRIRLALLLALEDEGYEAVGAATAEEGLRAQRRAPADYVLVDLMLPGLDGFECIRQIRRDDDVPIVVVSARDDTHDIVAALEAGADDYVVKPVAIKELTARLRALRRRARSTVSGQVPEPVPVLAFGELEISPDAGEVRCAGQPVPVTRTEFRLLCELAEHAGRVLSRQQLLSRVWGYDNGDERLVDVHVGRLRQKIEPDPANPKHLVTLRGLGYKLQR
ncbi:response regulator transcription factor [Micromonospora sp. NBC_00617]|uniref:response regulator transcription factor n=1 Tax=Micromonospora sp. NBC_00617 TaxID=2903587 RepID=UPI0030E4E168